MEYILIQVNCFIYTGYSLFWAESDEQAEKIIFDMAATIDACTHKKQTIEVSWDETGTMCTAKCEDSTIQGKIYDMNEAEQLSKTLLNAFQIGQYEIDKEKQKEYQIITSLINGPQNTPSINVMMKKRWINYNP